MKTVLVFGLGLSGRSLISFYKKRSVKLLGYDDQKSSEEFPFPVYSHLKNLPLDQIDLIAYSPGIPKSHPLFLEAKKRKIPCKSEIEIGVQEIKGRCIGISGTNGKSTVTLLITHMLNHAKIPAIALGNIGTPLTFKVDELKNEVVVIELSSYQIDGLQFPFLDQGLLLNISEDHLDWYGSYQAYKDSKFSLQNCVKKKGCFLLEEELYKTNRENIYFPHPKFFNSKVPYANEAWQKYWKSLGLIHQLNCSAACLALEPFQIEASLLLSGLQSFKGLSHRLEWVDQIEGRQFINDSKSTNIDALKQALCSFLDPICLIMGGKDKGLDFSPLVPYVKSKVKKIYAIGEIQNQIADQLSKGAKVETLGTLSLAFEKAFSESLPGEVILLSPGTSSFDQFKNFEHRGNEFKRLVSQLKGVRV